MIRLNGLAIDGSIHRSFPSGQDRYFKLIVRRDAAAMSDVPLN
jgi:hypothetical protein